jgi:glycerol-1-phosphate dehydrogenase [NAD(P)+]
LRSDEVSVATVESRLPEDVGWLIAVGDGTIHDITRFVANRRGMPFIAYPTAAAVDAYASAGCTMTWYGFKKTAPAVAPAAVVADTDVFASAPYRLTASGMGETLGKYTSIADWRIASLITGERYCSKIAALLGDAADAVRRGMSAVQGGDKFARESLMYALLVSGAAMQILGTSRPASGAEHHMSHLWEMEVINPHLGALHGEKVGVGTVIILRRYKEMLAGGELARFGAIGRSAVSEYAGIPFESLKSKFGRLYDSIEDENTPDILKSITPDALSDTLPEICDIVSELPEPGPLESEMAAAGCKVSLGDIGLGENKLRDSLELSPYVRSRLTLQRLSKLIRR